MVSRSGEELYAKAPITEAIIALHFEHPLEQKLVEKFAAKQKKEFPRSEQLMKHEFKIEAGRPSHRSTPNGVKLTSADQSRITTISLNQLAVSHLAPYKEWKVLYEDARDQWHRFVEVVGKKTLQRVSTRFINRIDIPTRPDTDLDLHTYLNVGASLPSSLSQFRLTQFRVECSLLDETGRFMNVLQIASQSPSPLIDYLSLLLDIDVYTVSALAPDEEGIWNTISHLRLLKNDLFEASITNKTRELFR